MKTILRCVSMVLFSLLATIMLPRQISASTPALLFNPSATADLIFYCSYLGEGRDMLGKVVYVWWCDAYLDGQWFMSGYFTS